MHKPLPAYISTSDFQSFARQTIEKRKPAILDLLIKENDVDDCLRTALLDFKTEIQTGVISDPFDAWPRAVSWLEGMESRIWRAEIEAHRGKSWIGIPWYFAEAFFYLRLLLTWGFFDPESAYRDIDPFQPSKDRQLYSSHGGLDLGKRLYELIQQNSGSPKMLESLILFSLWGNRIDLSNFSISDELKERVLITEEHNLIRNDLERLTQTLQGAHRIDFILDNCGPELMCDLVLALYLLEDPKKTVHLHAKKHPFFVSDAMIKDIRQTINALLCNDLFELKRTGRRLQGYIAQGRLHLREHFFWTSARHFSGLPPDLLEEFSSSDIVIFKGDANYRRLLSDRKWDPWTDMASIVNYFPSSFATLRTMKSEIVIDVDRELFMELNQKQPDWQIRGELGIIRVCQKERG